MLIKQKDIIKYNKSGDRELSFWAVTNTLFKYQYYSEWWFKMRKEIIISPKNKTNYKTITKQVWSNNKWNNVSRIEIGEKYNTYYEYDGQEKEKFIKRYNKEAKTLMIKDIMKGSEDANIWIMNYNGKKTVGFKIDVNKLK